MVLVKGDGGRAVVSNAFARSVHMSMCDAGAFDGSSNCQSLQLLIVGDSQAGAKRSRTSPP